MKFLYFLVLAQFRQNKKKSFGEVKFDEFNVPEYLHNVYTDTVKC